MNANRRNLYRILHVQPEAPVEVIRASVRTLLGPLRMHPDKGGDHDTAAMINEAWRVLGDPALRAAYDRTLAPPARRRAGASAGAAPAGAPGTTPRPAAAKRDDTPACPFCEARLAAAPAPAQRCGRCDAPLTRVAGFAEATRDTGAGGGVGGGAGSGTGGGTRELFGRRRTRRVARSAPLVVYARWDAGPQPGRLHDLSFEGASFDAPAAHPAGRVLRIVSRELDALVQVLAVRAGPGAAASGRPAASYRHHARLLSVAFTRRDGVFVSAVA
ncbi:MAG: J domain-containing protein [Lautropia sp.]